ncbi:MAG: serine hydrolase [Ekhidna sp.]
MNLIKANFLWITLLVVGCSQTNSLSKEEAQINNIEKLKAVAESYGDRLAFSGNILIGQGDEIVYHGSFGYANLEGSIPNNGNTIFRTASISKQLTACALLALEQQKRIDLDEPIATYLPGIDTKWSNRITIHHLLSHSSGLGRDIESLSSKQLGGNYISVDELVSIIGDSDLLFEPGAKWSYSNLGYTLAAKIIENVTNQSFGIAMKELVFDPIGMQNTSHEISTHSYENKAQGLISLPEQTIDAKYEDKSYVVGAGSIQSTTKDLFLWARQVLSGSYLNEKSRSELFEIQQGKYSYGWFIANYVWPVDDGIQEGLNLHHDGGSPGFSSKISLLKEHDIVVIILSNKLPSPIGELANKLTNMSVGFDDEPLAKMDGSEAFFRILFDKGVEGADSLAAEWKEIKADIRTPSKSDILLIGRGYLDNKEYEKASKVMDYLIQTYPKWTYPPLFKGIAMEEQGRTEEAISLYEQVLKINPKQSNALNRLKMLKAQ